jgi:hypothetical protein
MGLFNLFGGGITFGTDVRPGTSVLTEIQNMKPICLNIQAIWVRPIKAIIYL